MSCNQTKIHGYNRELAKEAGATFMFGTEAWYIVMDGGAVAGLVAKQGEDYIKFNCKAVVCACGGFGGNEQMMNDFIPDMYNALVGDEHLYSMSGNDGRGVQMAYWAGAHLETTPVGGMNMKGLAVPGKMNVLPQAVWIDERGKRFCNEYYPTSEQRGWQAIFMNRSAKFAVVDDNFTEYRQYTLPQHAGFTASEENIAALRESLDTAYAKFNGTYEEPAEEEGQGGPAGGPMTSVEFFADDTLEGLAAQMGLEGAAAEAFVQQNRRLEPVLRRWRRPAVRPRRRRAVPRGHPALLRLQVRARARRDHGHHGRHHHRRRAERARQGLQPHPRPVCDRQRLRPPLRPGIRDADPRLQPRLLHHPGPRVRQVGRNVPDRLTPGVLPDIPLNQEAPALCEPGLPRFAQPLRRRSRDAPGSAVPAPVERG